jgi:uncharacterized protein YbjQ (UPF0145 family)
VAYPGAMSSSGTGHPSLPISTTFEVPGSRVVESKGSCFGLVVRSIGVVRGITGGFRSMFRGEVPQYTEVLEDSRRHAVDRMVDNARLLGANAIVGMRFDSSEVGGGLTEIVAYGTAVVIDSDA